jgi:hypothetical protein
VSAQISALAPQLTASRQKACVVIATDGESSDGDIASALRPLEQLPVWVVVRLCTDQQRVVSYWNNIDNELELEMDVLDDLFGEAAEVHQANPWLNYSEPLHRLREFGISAKELDLLDEKLLSLENVATVCSMIFGGSKDNYPNPHVDWNRFQESIRRGNRDCGKVWSLFYNEFRDWINLSELARNHKISQSACIIL